MVRARAIKLPEFKLEAVAFPEAIKRLEDAGQRYDPRRKGFQFILDFREKSKAQAAAKTRITLNLKDVTLTEAAERVCRQVDGFELYSGGEGAIVSRPARTKR